MVIPDLDYKEEMGRMMVRDNLEIDNVPWGIDGGGKESVSSTMESLDVCRKNSSWRKE